MLANLINLIFKSFIMLSFIILFYFYIINVQVTTPTKIELNNLFPFNRSENTPLSEIPDGHLLTPEIFEKYGYKSEVHYVHTEDGYILALHRMAKPNGQPCFFMHGLSDSSAGFILAGPKKALPYMLASLGYDVWIGNARGNRYSRNHTKMNPDTNDSFWDFSWHEIAIYDMPAMIDYILNVTKFKQLYYFGHSMGTTVFFVLCSKRPEYNEKIKMMHAFAPSAYYYHIRAPARPIWGYLMDRSFVNSITEVVPVKLGSEFCKTFSSACIAVVMIVVGPDFKQFDWSLIPTMLGHVPSSYAMKQIQHYYQLTTVDRFCEFDYGSAKNMKKYGKAQPPAYNLKKITAPVILHYSLNDLIISPIAVERIRKELGNCWGKYQVPMKDFNHLDYLVAMDVRELLYERVVKSMKDFENGKLEKIFQ